MSAFVAKALAWGGARDDSSSAKGEADRSDPNRPTGLRLSDSGVLAPPAAWASTAGEAFGRLTPMRLARCHSIPLTLARSTSSGGDSVRVLGSNPTLAFALALSYGGVPPSTAGPDSSEDCDPFS
jgi:hypothetical protein